MNTLLPEGNKKSSKELSVRPKQIKRGGKDNTGNIKTKNSRM